MKLLWLTIDRSMRVMQHFDTMQRDVAELVDVTFVRRGTEGMEASDYCYAILSGDKKIPKYDFEYHGFDFIICDAFFAYASPEWEKLPSPKGILFEDMHGPAVRQLMLRALDYGVDVVFHRYQLIKQVHPELKLWESLPYTW